MMSRKAMTSGVLSKQIRWVLLIRAGFAGVHCGESGAVRYVGERGGWRAEMAQKGQDLRGGRWMGVWVVMLE